MAEFDFKASPIPKESGRKMDLLLALHMEWKHWSGSELSEKLDLDTADGKYPDVSIPRFSTDHNAFFEHVASHFINMDMGFSVTFLIEDQVWQVKIGDSKQNFVGKSYDLPHAGSIAAISALRQG